MEEPSILGKVGGEMAEERRLFDDAVSGNLPSLFPNGFQNLQQIIEMALGVDAARKGKADEFEWRRDFLLCPRIDFSEHHTSQFDDPHPPLHLNFVCQPDARIARRFNVRQEFLGIQKNGMASDGTDIGNPRRRPWHFFPGIIRVHVGEPAA